MQLYKKSYFLTIQLNLYASFLHLCTFRINFTEGKWVPFFISWNFKLMSTFELCEFVCCEHARDAQRNHILWIHEYFVINMSAYNNEIWIHALLNRRKPRLILHQEVHINFSASALDLDCHASLFTHGFMFCHCFDSSNLMCPSFNL